MTNYERIKLMNKKELANFLYTLLDENEYTDIGCFDCCNYGTHHFLDCSGSCYGCENYDIGDDVMKWLEKECE